MVTESTLASPPLYSLEEKFQACVDIIQSLPEEGPAPTTYVARLAMYGLYKQVTLGPCHTSQPGFWNPEGRAKWDAWKRLGDMDREQAMEFYVAIVLEAIDVGAETLDWNEYLEKYSDLYEQFQFLREKFQILDRELVKADGSKVVRPRNGPTDLERLCAGPYSLEEKFNASVEILHTLPRIPITDLIKSVWSHGSIGLSGPIPISLAEMFTMYAFYKQATLGPCKVGKPFWNIVERYKWDAWKRMGDMNRDQAMAGYVAGLLEKIDNCAETLKMEDMLATHAEDYERLEPILREKFRIIDRELINSDGSRMKHTRFNNHIVGILSFNLDRAKAREILEGKSAEDELDPVDPSSDAEYYDVEDSYDNTNSRSSSISDPQHFPDSATSLKKSFKQMEKDILTITTTLNALRKELDNRHPLLISIIKKSRRLPWRSLFFYIIWPFIAYWAMRFFAGQRL